MFCSNQLLTINGDSTDILKKAIEFVCTIDEKSITKIRGCKIQNGCLIFGWIPEILDENNKSTGNYEYNYVNLWSTTLLDPLLPPTLNILINIIMNWLDSDEVAEQYDKLYDQYNCKYWDNPTKGWKLTAISDECGLNAPTFSVFYIEPTWTEYLD